MRRRCLAFTILLPVIAILAGCATQMSRPGRTTADDSPAFWSTTNFATFKRTINPATGQQVWTSPEWRAPMLWDELVLSWNAQVPPGAGLKFEVRALAAGRPPTEFYTMGFWAEDTAEFPRESVTGQKDEEGDVLTDTLALRWLADRFQVRITFLGTNVPGDVRLKFLGASFLNAKAVVSPMPSQRVSWGKALPVPERSQLSDPGGRDWCSPTSVSMVLAYWAAKLERPELTLPIAVVAAGIYDKNWPGTGNWSFNAAFAGKFAGMRAYVTRLADISELEALVAVGIPPIVSVSYDLLHGKAQDKGNGHLVVCIGFTDTGEVVINDPWAELEKRDPIRYIIPRAQLTQAWAKSRQTVYLIYPESLKVPRSSVGRW